MLPVIPATKREVFILGLIVSMWVWGKVAIAVIYYDSRDLSLHLKEMN